MRSVGVCVHLAKKGRPAARVVLLDGTWGAAAEHARFDLTSNKQDIATILHDLATGLRSLLSGMHADCVVIRRADKPKKPSNLDGSRLRLLAEGALASAARDEVADVLILPGKDLAQRSPATSKDDLESEAEKQVPGGPVEATAAALSGLVP